MKKVMKEWKKWLLETTRTNKALGQPERERSGPYDRAVRHVEMGKNYREAAKLNIKNYLTSNRNPSFLARLKDQLRPEDIDKIINDINTMIWIYSGNTQYQIGISTTVYQSGDKYGLMYDNQPDVVGDPVKKLSNVLKILGGERSMKEPSESEIRDVYIYYIHPNYHTVKQPSGPKRPSSRFAKALSMSPEKLAQMNRAALKRKK